MTKLKNLIAIYQFFYYKLYNRNLKNYSNICESIHRRPFVMAKKAVFFILFIMIVSASFLSAETGTASIYPKTIAINRIYPHALGYKVEYIKSNRTLGTFYAPLDWFRKTGGYGEIAYGFGSQYPYATFYYMDGKIDHFRLYLVEDFNDPSWGILRGDDYTEEFNVEELVIEYQ
jgi:hypothetical protein